MAELNRFEERTLDKKTLALHVFTDTFSDRGGDPVDFDSELTTDYRHLRFRDTRYGIGKDVVRGAYAVDLVDQLHGQVMLELDRALLRSRKLGRFIHPDLHDGAARIATQTVRVVANSAPRDPRYKNGSNFYLAITENGVEVYATPLDILQYVKGRIVSLFEIPNEGHPLFDGEKEQFRSSVIGRTCQEPEHLVRVDKAIIPDQKKNLELSFADKFGNLRCRAGSAGEVLERIDRAKKGLDAVGVKINGMKTAVRAHLVDCLAEVPVGEWGLYTNVADGALSEGRPGYFELVRRWESSERINGYDQLGKPQLGEEVQIVSI